MLRAAFDCRTTRDAISGMKQFESVIKINITIKSEHSSLACVMEVATVSGNCQSPSRVI